MADESRNRGGYALAFDLGGSFFKAGLVSAAGEILKRERVAVPAGRDAACALLGEIAGRLTAGLDSPVAGIGIGAPGEIDRVRVAVSGGSANLPHLSGVPLAPLFADISGNVAIDNDATNAARGELAYGAARGCRNALVMTIGTGIGGGLVLDGAIYGGASGYAGEFGHTVIVAGGRRCTCGGEGCLEAYVSAWALRQEARAAVARFPDSSLAAIRDREIEPLDLSEAAAHGDILATELLAAAGRHLGIAVASVVNLLNLDAVIVGGGISAAGDALFGPLERQFRIAALPAAARACRIVPAQLGNDAGMLGAARLVFGAEKAAR